MDWFAIPSQMHITSEGEMEFFIFFLTHKIKGILFHVSHVVAESRRDAKNTTNSEKTNNG